MTVFQALILGIVQGVTEFLPISSSGHLVLVPYWLGWEVPGREAFLFDVLVQLGTLLGVIAYFWDDLVAILREMLIGLWKRQPFATPNARLGWLLALATIPAAVIGFLLKDQVEAAFGSIKATAVSLLVTAVLLALSEWIGKRTRDFRQLSWLDALWIGFFQALSIFPGISRSGATITGGMTRNLERPSAARFSFLMSIPIMLGAGAFAALDLPNLSDLGSFLTPMLVGFVTAAVVGYVAIRWLLGYLTRHPLYVFSGYLLVVSLLTLVAL